MITITNIMITKAGLAGGVLAQISFQDHQNTSVMALGGRSRMQQQQDTDDPEEYRKNYEQVNPKHAQESIYNCLVKHKDSLREEGTHRGLCLCGIQYELLRKRGFIEDSDNSTKNRGQVPGRLPLDVEYLFNTIQKQGAVCISYEGSLDRVRVRDYISYYNEEIINCYPFDITQSGIIETAQENKFPSLHDETIAVT